MGEPPWASAPRPPPPAAAASSSSARFLFLRVLIRVGGRASRAVTAPAATAGVCRQSAPSRGHFDAAPPACCRRGPPSARPSLPPSSRPMTNAAGRYAGQGRGATTRLSARGFGRCTVRPAIDRRRQPPRRFLAGRLAGAGGDSSGRDSLAAEVRRREHQSPPMALFH